MNSMITWLKNQFLPFLRWIWELKNPNILKADLIAWATVALVLIPQSMAYAQLAWLSPIYWLYASFLPVMISAFWWSSRQLATWPVAIVSLITAATLEPLATSWAIQYAVYAAFLALIVGIIQLTLGLVKMWKLVDFLSHPVIVWFTNAAAIVIAASQLNKIFGLSFGQELQWGWILEKADHKYTEIWNVVQAALTNTDYTTFIIGAWSIILLVLMKKFVPKVPGVLVAVVWFTLISYFIDYEGMWWLVVWQISAGLPSLTIPFMSELFDWNTAKTLATAAVTIAILGFAEAISVAKAMASESKKSISANQELIGQWLWNIAASFSQWYPVSWSFSRSAVNFGSWAQTGFSSIVTWILVAVTLLFLTPLLYHLPQATLAAVIMVAVAGLIKIKPIIHARNVERQDWIVAIIVFIVTLVSAPHLEKWLIVWIALSLAFFIYRSMTPDFVEIAMYKDGELRNIRRRHLQSSENVWVYKFEWPLYFASAWYFEWKLIKFVKNKPEMKLIVLDIGWVDEIDSSWLEALQTLLEWFEKVWIKVLISRVRWRVYRAMKRWHFIKHFGIENIFRISRHEALTYAKEELKLEINIEPYFKYMPKEWKKDKHISIGKRILQKLHIKNFKKKN